jgi:hypothetical protein
MGSHISVSEPEATVEMSPVLNVDMIRCVLDLHRTQVHEEAMVIPPAIAAFRDALSCTDPRDSLLQKALADVEACVQNNAACLKATHSRMLQTTLALLPDLVERAHAANGEHARVSDTLTKARALMARPSRR